MVMEAKAHYSTSIKEQATYFYLQEHQEITLLPKYTMQVVMEEKSFLLPTQSALQPTPHYMLTHGLYTLHI